MYSVMKSESKRYRVWLMMAVAGFTPSLATPATASPVSVVATGELQTTYREFDYNLDGASVTVVYTADTTDVATATGLYPGHAWSSFDVFDMSVRIDNRPNGASDLNLGVLGRNDPFVTNTFAPETRNDYMDFDSRSVRAEEDFRLEIDALFLDLGSQNVFSGRDNVIDLGFLAEAGLTLNLDTSIDLEWVFSAAGGRGEEEFRVNNLSITHQVIPEPSSIAIWATLCLASCSFRRKM